MTIPKLRLIDGGGGGGSVFEKPFTPHPYADYLWNAIYPKGCRQLSIVAERMSKSAGIEISEQTARVVITHVRDNAFGYNWTIPPVQKGRLGLHRKYVVALVDPADPDYSISAADCGDHLIVVRKGALSAGRTIATQGEHAGISLEVFANASHLSRSEKREIRAASSMFVAASKMVRDVVGKLEVSALA